MTDNTVPPTEPDDLTEVLRGLLSRLDIAQRRLLDFAAAGGRFGDPDERLRLVAKASGVALAHDYVRAELTRIAAPRG